MGTIQSYIKKFGHLSFKELEFNDVDNVIFAVLSYLDFDGIIDIFKKVSLNSAARSFFSKYGMKEINKNIISVKNAAKVLDLIKDTNRYSNLLLYNYVYKCNYEKQFSAMFIDIDEALTYISFEGTDDKVSGWLEDGALSYQFPIPAQREAIKYVNHNISIFSKRKYILGGHSKGGNLALVAGMYANPLIRGKIIKIISNDGPGLRLKELESKKYKKIEDIYDLIVPEYSVVGLLLQHKEPMHVIGANKKGLMAHNAGFWEVEGVSLKPAKLSDFSKKVDNIIKRWLKNYNMQERKEFLADIADILDSAGIDSLLDIKASMLSSLVKLIKESSRLDKRSKDIIMDFVNIIMVSLKEDVKSAIKAKF